MNDSLPRPLNGRSPDARRARFAALMALASALLFGLAPAAHAERADKDKPLNIEADNMTYDDLKQQTVFTGHVVATKGTILIKADKLVVTQDPQGYQFATGTVAPGTPAEKLAYFRQKREGLDEYVDGTAERIDYDGKQDLTTLTTRATVRRLQGLSTVMDQVHGSVVTYDGQNDFYTARSGKDVAGPGNPGGRVRAMLSPRNTTTGAQPPAGAPAALTPSTKLQEAPPQ
ncbi:lipopolysaccharide transport periplasmic protein LptA [Paraburkholderia sp. CNPSo 3272]|uniref:lipopolysaccharide transport periplasmic protein LptA n=1 Tax=Paraburkholderia sp. CNPSo 3272 TaxID=2940931 RepID=UPI0020B8ABBF|nr:lipopolysaccharide transport periplasmic protein LptA [Paraburkholderia sp. CNPSo 3272]MCP3722212.1 lipopolysaccharide transport periplasmic protein LptA [Paraburkholderia sp. CNPSo 3272]